MHRSSYHDSVMPDESTGFLVHRPNGCYADFTLGGGGHSNRILEKLGPNGRLFGFDQDPNAWPNAPVDPRFTLVKGNFSFAANFLRAFNALPLDGYLADLGVSSHQFDEAGRGFSIRYDARLDMRMNPTSVLTAAKVINEYEPKELAQILGNYGSIDKPFRIVNRLVAERSKEPVETTGKLIELLRPFSKPGEENQFYARVFQALRMEVNSELEVLKRLLEQTPQLLNEGGRAVVISYHSGEDQLVKRFFQFGNFEGKSVKDFYGNLLRPLHPLTRKVIVPTEQEVAQNPRSRSAKMRVAEKLTQTPKL